MKNVKIKIQEMVIPGPGIMRLSAQLKNRIPKELARRILRMNMPATWHNVTSATLNALGHYK